MIFYISFSSFSIISILSRFVLMARRLLNYFILFLFPSKSIVACSCYALELNKKESASSKDLVMIRFLLLSIFYSSFARFGNDEILCI